MKTSIKLTLLAAAAALTIPGAHAQTISNGGFEDNGLLFTGNNGYVNGGNPATITDWTLSTTNGGINGRPAPQVTPFLPLAPITQGTSAAFLQGVGSATSLSQTVTGLTVSSQYWVTYRENARAGNLAVSSSVQLGGTTIVADHAVASTSVFQLRVSDAYTATGTSADLVLNNTSTVFDNTLVLDDVRLYYVTPNAAPVGMNSSFETNTLTGTEVIQGSTVGGVPGALWGFTGGAGIAKNGSAFGNPAAPDGTTAALIQGLGSFSDAYGTFETGKQYQLTLDVAARAGGGNEFSVTLGGEAIQFGGLSTYTPSNTGSYMTLTSDFFTVSTAGPKELLFTGLTNADRTTFIDNIAIIPEPSTAVMLFVGLGAMAILRRRRTA